MRKLLTGLRTEIVLNIAVLMIAATTLIGFIVLKVSEQAALDQKVRSAKVILDSIQSSLKYGESTGVPGDIGNIQRLIEIFYDSGGMEALFVVNRDMRIIAHSNRNEVGKINSDEDIRKGILEKSVTTIVGRSLVSVSSPLYLKSDIFGGVKVILPTADVKEAATKSLRLIFFYVILNSVILVIFGSILLSRTIVRPIDELVRVTESVAGGDLNQRIKGGRRNEFGMLAESFNTMTEKLRNGKDALEANIKRLEEVNEDLKKAQNEVIRAEKMASVGRLAAGVAHEIGNPLSAILGYTNVLQSGSKNQEEAEYLKRIEKEIDRIDRIVRNLLNYARPGEMKVFEIDINESIRNSVDLVSSQKGFDNIEIRQEFQDIPLVKAEPHQFQQVLVNLFINAADAMPEGGKVVVGSKVRNNFSQAWVEVSVSDTGTGMTDEEIKKIFDPFFTTKEPGKGTGLGLAICQRIVESFGGNMEVESRKGEGSRFSILLPLTRGMKR